MPLLSDTLGLMDMLLHSPQLVSLSVDMAHLLLLEPMLHMVMLLVDTMLLTLLVLFMLPRERLRLNQRLMLRDSTTHMDMVLDLSMEDTLPMSDQLSLAMLLLWPILLLTPDLLDTLTTMARERLMLMLSTAPMDMVLVLDLSMEDTPPTPDQLSPATPDQLFPAMPDQLFPPLDTLPIQDQSMEVTPEVSMDSTKLAFTKKENQRH